MDRLLENSFSRLDVMQVTLVMGETSGYRVPKPSVVRINFFPFLVFLSDPFTSTLCRAKGYSIISKGISGACSLYLFCFPLAGSIGLTSFFICAFILCQYKYRSILALVQSDPRWPPVGIV